MVATSLPSGSARVIRSRNPFCRRSQGRISCSMRLVNLSRELGFRRTDTLRANMIDLRTVGMAACEEPILPTHPADEWCVSGGKRYKKGQVEFRNDDRENSPSSQGGARNGHRLVGN